jgi:hypothetical protein
MGVHRSSHPARPIARFCRQPIIQSDISSRLGYHGPVKASGNHCLFAGCSQLVHPVRKSRGLTILRKRRKMNGCLLRDNFRCMPRPDSGTLGMAREVNMTKDDFSPAAYYRQPKVNWKTPTLPPTHVQNATLAEYYREPKVNWKIPTPAIKGQP